MATPGDYSTNLELWLKADAISGLSDGNPIGTWSDSSGLGANATASSTQRPTYKTGVLNGMPVARFGGSQFMTSGAPSYGAAQTIVAVVKSTNLGATNTIRGGGGGTGGLQFRIEAASNPSYLRFVKESIADIGSGSTTIAASTWHVVTGTWDDAANTYAFTIDGVAAGSGSSAVNLTLFTSTTIGAANSGGEAFVGDIAEMAAWSRVLNSTELSAVTSGLASKWGLAASSAVSVSAPVLAVVAAVPSPSVSAGSAVSVAAPALGVAFAVPAPQVAAGTGVRVDSPILGVSTAVIAPTVSMVAGVAVAAPVLSMAVAAPAPAVSAGASVSVVAPALSVAVAVPAPVVSMGGGWTPGDTLVLSAPAPVYAGLSFEVFVAPSEVLTLSAVADCVATLRIHPVPVPIPAGITDRPLMRRAHLMDPKTPANPRKQGDELRAVVDGDDGYNYPIESAPVGRLRVFASGIDVTYLTGAPTTVSEWSFAKPLSCQAASFTVPLPEWNYPGPYAGPHGNLPIFWGDAPVEICLEDTLGDLHSLWDGFTAEESDTAAPGQTGVTFNCSGTLQQAAHWLWDPPAVMEPRDVGHVIADAMNAVPNRRYAKIKRFTTGILTENRGDSSQSVLAYVVDRLGEAFDADGNQLTFRRYGPFGYELAWAQPVAVEDFTFTKGSPGFDMTLARPHAARRDMVFARGIAPDGGFWMNRYFPGLAVAAPPVYPMGGFANISVGTTDAGTTTGKGVTTWQRRMRELGYPVTVDGVMNSADTKWVLKIQKDRGITVDGSLGPQTWAATWEGPQSTPETDTVRLPLDVKDIARQYDRDASGAIIRPNPVFDKQKILHATPEVDAGTNIKKSTFRPIAAKIREREASPGYVGTLTATGVDPHEPDTSRLFITEGRNVLVDGHHWGTVVQVADVTHTPTATRMTVDSGARGQALVDAILSRQRDVRRSLSGKSTRVTDRGTLNASQLGQYESESPAGKFPRTAINGDSGLWTVRCIYVAEQGLARFRLTSSPDAEIVTAIFGKKVTPNFIAARVANPLSDDSGWYDHEKSLKAAGLINVAGTPDSPGGYWPWQKSDGKGKTGVQAAGNLSLKSERGGFFWVAVYTSKSAFVEGEFEPEVPTS